MTDQNEREPGALDMWRARQGVVISGIAVDRAHRTEVDLARAEVERLSIEAAELRADLQMVRSQRDEAWAERCERDQQETAQQPAEADRWASTPRQLQIVRASDTDQEVERLSSELAMSVGIVTQLDIENQRLNRDNDELRLMCEVVERIQGERDRARDLAVRAGAFDNPHGQSWGEEGWRAAVERARDLEEMAAVCADMEEQRDQALYERDQCRESVEFSRGLIPTRPR